MPPAKKVKLTTCSNCQKLEKYQDCITIDKGNTPIAVLCLSCQHAKKIQVTLVRDGETWKFQQYFPVEA